MTHAVLKANNLPAIGLLDAVVALVRAAGDRLVTEFTRPTGPRGVGDKADIDTEIEWDLRTALLALRAARYAGEETGTGGDPASTECWLVDPHDGTSAFLAGARGTAVSVGLLRDGHPVLGVVYAPLPPDRDADMIAWAEELPHVLRNGRPVAAKLSNATLTGGSLVLLNLSSDRRPLANGACVAPGRFIALPSIAYRLARVAAGGAVAAVSLNAPCGHDYAAGHALLIGAGGVLVDKSGAPVTYTPDGESYVSECFGGAAPVVQQLHRRPWHRPVAEPAQPAPAPLAWPRPARQTALDRAVGCLFGQVIGDSLGSLVEFDDADEIAAEYPGGVRDLADSGTWNTLAGQPTDDSELALALARTLTQNLARMPAGGGAYDAEAAAASYGRWYASSPFDIGSTTSAALSAA